MSNLKPNGELIPVGGGDNIPLLRARMTVGRRENCDICMNFPNISSLHCELTYREGFWYIRDLNSTNGVKVNGVRVQQEKLLRSRDEVTIGKRTYHIEYEMPIGALVEDRETEDIFSQSLLERAGLEKKKEDRPSGGRKRPSDPIENYLLDDDD